MPNTQARNILDDAPAPVQKLFRDLWRDIEVANQERAIAAAKADPERHKLSKLIADHKPAQYFYMTESTTRRGRRGRSVRWCWSQHPNVAGYFLSWRQVETSRQVKRTKFKAHKHQYLGEQRATREVKRAADRLAGKTGSAPGGG